MRVLVLFLILFVNVIAWGPQRERAVAIFSDIEVERGYQKMPLQTPVLTLEVFDRAMRGEYNGVVVLDFHGATLPDGRHEGVIEGRLVRFRESDIPPGVYVSSCRHPIEMSAEEAPKHLFEGVANGKLGGFLGPVGYQLTVSPSRLFNYRSYRPYKVWLHFMYMAMLALVILTVYWKKTPILVGDVHARPLLTLKALFLGFFKRRKVLFAGDLLDGPSLKLEAPERFHPFFRERLLAIPSVICLKLARYCPWADTILGNHEVYPLWFGDSPQSLAEAWGEGSCPKTTARLWREWKAIEFFLTKGDLRWLRTRPIYIEGPTWTFVHAKVPLGGLIGIDPFIGDKGPTSWQLEVVDGTKGWKPPSCPVNNSTSLLYVGHTPINKVGGKAVWHDSLFMLDWGAKKGKGTAAWVVAGARNLKPL